ncbi:MAG: hypothetical protein M1827_005490 [Pycnora praestabilis]|nr:MAG: hypothetical protein M1827_005490 [Pycnora praestabilis]
MKHPQTGPEPITTETYSSHESIPYYCDELGFKSDTMLRFQFLSHLEIFLSKPQRKFINPKEDQVAFQAMIRDFLDAYGKIYFSEDSRQRLDEDSVDGCLFPRDAQGGTKLWRIFEALFTYKWQNATKVNTRNQTKEDCPWRSHSPIRAHKEQVDSGYSLRPQRTREERNYDEKRYFKEMFKSRGINSKHVSEKPLATPVQPSPAQIGKGQPRPAKRSETATSSLAKNASVVIVDLTEHEPGKIKREADDSEEDINEPAASNRVTSHQARKHQKAVPNKVDQRKAQNQTNDIGMPQLQPNHEPTIIPADIIAQTILIVTMSSRPGRQYHIELNETPHLHHFLLQSTRRVPHPRHSRTAGLRYDLSLLRHSPTGADDEEGEGRGLEQVLSGAGTGLE